MSELDMRGAAGGYSIGMPNRTDNAATLALPKSRYAFLTLPNYSLIAVTNALEPLRMANRVVGEDVYDWSIVSLDGRPIVASSGLDLAPTIALHKLGKVDILLVCGGINVRDSVSPA